MTTNFRKARKMGRGEIMFRGPQDAEGVWYMEEERKDGELVKVTFTKWDVPK